MLYLSIENTSTEIDFFILYTGFLGLWTRVRVFSMIYLYFLGLRTPFFVLNASKRSM